jgi:hypothetical protein
MKINRNLTIASMAAASMTAYDNKISQKKIA